MRQVDINDYVHSNEWALVGHPAKKNVKHYSCCVEPYPDLTFTVQLKRVAAFYHYILVLPCVLLSFLTLVIFWLPPESPAKILLGKLPTHRLYDPPTDNTNTDHTAYRPTLRPTNRP